MCVTESTKVISLGTRAHKDDVHPCSNRAAQAKLYTFATLKVAASVLPGPTRRSADLTDRGTHATYHNDCNYPTSTAFTRGVCERVCV